MLGECGEKVTNRVRVSGAVPGSLGNRRLIIPGSATVVCVDQYMFAGWLSRRDPSRQYKSATRGEVCELDCRSAGRADGKVLFATAHRLH